MANSFQSNSFIAKSNSFKNTNYRTTTNNVNDSINYIDNQFDSDDEENWKSKPDVWSDDVRMNALFAPFRNRELNPLHYDNKLKFWKEVIVSYCIEKQIIQFDQKILENCFIRKNIKPKCLELVLNELVKERSITTREDILKPKTSLIQNMLNRFVWSPISWSTSYLFKSFTSNASSTTIYSCSSTSTSSYVLSSPKSSSTLDKSILQSSPGASSKDDSTYKTFVLSNLVESKSQEILRLFQSNIVYRNVDCVIEYDKVLELTKEIISEKDLELCLKYLEANQKVLIIDSIELNRKLIKFSQNINQNVEPLINEVELSYLKLKQAEKKLELEADKLSSQIEELNTNIKSQLKLGNKNTALKLLKKRKQLEKSLDGKDGVLNNIETMIVSIQQADTNQITMDVYTKGLSALKEANKGVNIDLVDDTMCEIQDIYNQNNEIEEALVKSPSVSTKVTIDESELNQELEELLAQQDIENSPVFNQTQNDGSFRMDDLLKNLPSVPSDTPKKSTTSKMSDWSNH